MYVQNSNNSIKASLRAANLACVLSVTPGHNRGSVFSSASRASGAVLEPDNRGMHVMKIMCEYSEREREIWTSSERWAAIGKLGE